MLTTAAGVERMRKLAPDFPVVIDVIEWVATRSMGQLMSREITPLAPGPWMSERSLAYVLFTSGVCVHRCFVREIAVWLCSGTTGKPKGVMIEHRSIITLLRGNRELFELSGDDRVGQSASPSFDSGIEEAWVALSSGATVVVLDQVHARMLAVFLLIQHVCACV
jgi:acyl-CoA synthetase (AMP-forming)/AMP-acid ligase II